MHKLVGAKDDESPRVLLTGVAGGLVETLRDIRVGWSIARRRTTQNTIVYRADSLEPRDPTPTFYSAVVELKGDGGIDMPSLTLSTGS